MLTERIKEAEIKLSKNQFYEAGEIIDEVLEQDNGSKRAWKVKMHVMLMVGPENFGEAKSIIQKVLSGSSYNEQVEICIEIVGVTMTLLESIIGDLAEVKEELRVMGKHERENHYIHEREQYMEVIEVYTKIITLIPKEIIERENNIKQSISTINLICREIKDCDISFAEMCQSKYYMDQAKKEHDNILKRVSYSKNGISKNIDSKNDVVSIEKRKKNGNPRSSNLDNEAKKLETNEEKEEWIIAFIILAVILGGMIFFS